MRLCFSKKILHYFFFFFFSFALFLFFRRCSTTFTRCFPSPVVSLLAIGTCRFVLLFSFWKLFAEAAQPAEGVDRNRTKRCLYRIVGLQRGKQEACAHIIAICESCWPPRHCSSPLGSPPYIFLQFKVPKGCYSVTTLFTAAALSPVLIATMENFSGPAKKKDRQEEEGKKEKKKEKKKYKYGPQSFFVLSIKHIHPAQQFHWLQHQWQTVPFFKAEHLVERIFQTISFVIFLWKITPSSDWL